MILISDCCPENITFYVLKNDDIYPFLKIFFFGSVDSLGCYSYISDLNIYVYN